MLAPGNGLLAKSILPPMQAREVSITLPISLSLCYLFFQSLVTVGAMIGSCIGGWLIDKFGRKGSILMSAVPFELGWLLISFAKNHAMLYAGRIITGLACGVVSLAVPVSCS